MSSLAPADEADPTRQQLAGQQQPRPRSREGKAASAGRVDRTGWMGVVKGPLVDARAYAGPCERITFALLGPRSSLPPSRPSFLQASKARLPQRPPPSHQPQPCRPSSRSDPSYPSSPSEPSTRSGRELACELPLPWLQERADVCSVPSGSLSASRTKLHPGIGLQAAALRAGRALALLPRPRLPVPPRSSVGPLGPLSSSSPESGQVRQLILDLHFTASRVSSGRLSSSPGTAVSSVSPSRGRPQGRTSRHLSAHPRRCLSSVFKPLKNKTGLQSERLDSFYQGQAELYDATRGGLLKGRTTVRLVVELPAVMSRSREWKLIR